jgi:hypothetical protein
LKGEKKMSIYVYKNNQQAGPFEETAVLTWLNNGQLSGEDFGCQTGAKEWQKLKVLFANNPAPQPAAVSNVALPATGGGQAVSNQPAVNWARQNLQTPVKVKGLFNSLIVTVFSYAFLALFCLVPPCYILISTFYLFMTGGLQESHKVGLGIGIGWLVLGGGIFLFIVLIRRNIAKVLTSEGVKIRGRKKFLWENLRFLNHKTILARGGKKTAIEMVFANGKAVIPPHTFNKSEILRLLETLPVQRRDNGIIRY